MKTIITFIILRILDVISTNLSVNQNGLEVEVNPVSRIMLGSNYFIIWQIIISFVILYIFLKFNNKTFKTSINIFNILTFFVVGVNFLSYFLSIGFI